LIDLSSSSAPAEFECSDADIDRTDLDYVAPTGADELRELIAGDYPGLRRDHIVLTSGASEALAAFAHATLRPGAPVWTARGTYPSFLEAARRLGAEIKLTALPEPHLDVISLCNPSVPDGQLLNPGVFDRCRWLLVDESHLDLVHGGAGVRRAAGISPRTVSVSGISKSLGLGGVRIGWVASLDTDLLARVDREVQLLSGGPSSLSVATAFEALERRSELIARTLSTVRRNAPRVYAALDDFGWRYRRAEGGLTIEAWPPDSAGGALERPLLERGYFLIPCSVYDSPGSYRISLLCEPPQLREALAIVGEPARLGAAKPSRSRFSSLAERVWRSWT
jgi:aspartate/methionine/tyrosine aminotransferase